MTWKEFKEHVDAFLLDQNLEDQTQIIFIQLLNNPAKEDTFIFFDFVDNGLEISNQKTEF